ncbi:hypothetical protein D3C76_1637210 [compost metagenome]
MLLAGSSLDGGNDLAGYTKLGKSLKRRKLVTLEVTDCLIQANHAFLNDILPVRTN